TAGDGVWWPPLRPRRIQSRSMPMMGGSRPSLCVDVPSTAGRDAPAGHQIWPVDGPILRGRNFGRLPGAGRAGHGIVTIHAYTLAMFLLNRRQASMPTETQALPGRPDSMTIPERHHVNRERIVPPFPEGTRTAIFALGCFWGAEKDFWQTPGVVSTAVGYAGGFTPNATYNEACSGQTGHAESVLVVYDPKKVTYEQLLKVFW